jgi:flagellar hook-associated protein 1
MAGINTLLSIGRSALNASQVAISVTGTNISNVDTEGYSTQTVNLSDSAYTDGVDIDGVTRSYDSFVEAQYLEKIASRDRWQSLYNGLTGVESLLNESNTDGISSQLSTMFSDWSNLTSSTASNAATTTMLEDTDTLLSLLQSTSDSLASLKSSAQSAISDDVDTLNTLASQVAALNKQIGSATSGTESYNSLLDSRDSLIEQMASLVDVKVIDNGGSDLSVYLTSGQTVVDGSTSYTFSYENGHTVRQLSSSSIASDSDVQCYSSGSDSSEYTIKVVSAGNVNSGATFQVSLDGGKTWLTDDTGNVQIYSASSEDGKVKVGDLDIWFGTTSNASSISSSTLNVGDTFTLVPKKALYWYTSAGTPEIVSPQQYSDGTDNSRRLTGGSLCGALELVDTYVGSYENTLDSFTESLVWEINRLYSQGTGSTAYTKCSGTYSADETNVPLGSAASGLTYSSRLTSGASMLYIYNSSTGALASSAAIDFSSLHASSSNFDPTTDSLDDVATAINNTYGGLLTATIVNGQISLASADGYEFRFGDDTSGLYAALGLNTLLTGSTISDVAINSVMTSDTSKVCIGSVGTGGLVASGDTSTATALAALADTEVTFSINGKTVGTQTLSDYYNTLVGTVGSDTSSANYQYTYQSTLADSLSEAKLAVSAVSLDEELTKLIQYQYSYQAAAKLISTAESMYEIILGMKS